MKRAVQVVMAYFLKKRRSALPIPGEKGRMTVFEFIVVVVVLVPSRILENAGYHGISSREEGV